MLELNVLLGTTSRILVTHLALAFVSVWVVALVVKTAIDGISRMLLRYGFATLPTTLADVSRFSTHALFLFLLARYDHGHREDSAQARCG
jgi:hypothetical protein